MLAALLFLLSSNICGSNIETENVPHIDGLDAEHDDKTSRPAVNSEHCGGCSVD